MAVASDRVALVPNVVTQITQSDCTKIRVQLQTQGLVRFLATATATAPAATAFRPGVHLYERGALIPGDLTLANLFPEVVTPVRLWALADYDAVVTFGHD